MELTENEFVAASKRMAGGILDECRKLGMIDNDIANLMVAASGLVLREALGPMGAVNRLRDAADHFEDDILQGNRH